jgi:NADH:quinone reductase (non-electrogenic)
MALHIVIVGGGFGGLEAAFSLRNLLRSPIEITLIDRLGYHSFIPSIHEIIAGKVRPEAIRIPLAVVLRPAGINFIQDEVLSVDPGKREVIARESTLQYDYLVLSSGAENNFYGVPGVEELSYRFRTPGDAERIRADLEALLAEPGRHFSIVLAGGGTEGVEVAGELIDAIKDHGSENDLASGRISVDLVESREHLLPGSPLKAREFVDDYLSQRGVKLIFGSAIAEARKDRVILASGKEREMSMLLWTGGIQPTRLIRELPLPKDSTGWLKVTDLLSSPDDERVYGIGDAISIHKSGKPVPIPRLAYLATDQARIASLNISSSISGRNLVPYEPKIEPQLISLGRDMGILVEGERFFSGSWVVTLKKAIERKHLMTYLTKPVTSALAARIPGAGFLQRLWWRLPL